MSKELNRLAAILQVYAGSLIYEVKKREILLHLYELFIPFWFFVGLGPGNYRNDYLQFFKSLAYLAWRRETVLKKITQPKSPKRKN